MFKIYQTNSSLIQEKYSLSELLEKMPDAIKERALRYKFEADAYQFVVGRLLLRYGLKEMGFDDLLDKIYILENGKPYLEKLSFNISHSGNIVVCVLADLGQVGIDIEQHKQIKLSDFEAFFTPKEWIDIDTAENPLQKFFMYWTRKESIIKALGVNLSYLHQIEIDLAKNYFIEKEQYWYLYDLDFGEGYTGALCSDIDSELQKIELSAEVLYKAKPHL